jgi:hypothetical protein
MSRFAELQALGAVDKDADGKACILIFNLGAPSQLDTWDMKPDAPREIRGPFNPIKTNADFRSANFSLSTRKSRQIFSRPSCYHTAAAVHDTAIK